LSTAELRKNVELDAHVIMPNHMHGIIVLIDMSQEPQYDVVRAQRAAPEVAFRRQYGDMAKDSLSTIVRAYKSAVTRQINKARGTPGASVWHRNYYERVIRNERELEAIREYIVNNPAGWRGDPAYRLD
jgi:putative transposase